MRRHRFGGAAGSPVGLEYALALAEVADPRAEAAVGQSSRTWPLKNVQPSH
jgi:hypothetical protein